MGSCGASFARVAPAADSPHERTLQLLPFRESRFTARLAQGSAVVTQIAQ